MRETLEKGQFALMNPLISWTALSDGWTSAPEGAVLIGGSWMKRIRFHAVAFLLRHPTEGNVLVDTGYSTRFWEETRRFPNRIYRHLTKVSLTDPRGIAGQLSSLGIDPAEIQHLVITHFHADHIGGLRDFPAAKLYAAETAWESVRNLRGFRALKQAFLPGLLPEDITERLRFVKEGSDLFGDGSIQILDLPGHAPGQIGLRFLDDTDRPVLLAADAAWLSDAFRENRMPHPLTKFLNDWEPYRATLQRLHDLYRKEPDLLILPTHCPETAAFLK